MKRIMLNLAIQNHAGKWEDNPPAIKCLKWEAKRINFILQLPQTGMSMVKCLQWEPKQRTTLWMMLRLCLLKSLI
jgi:hypothetical protein